MMKIFTFIISFLRGRYLQAALVSIVGAVIVTVITVYSNVVKKTGILEQQVASLSSELDRCAEEKKKLKEVLAYERKQYDMRLKQYIKKIRKLERERNQYLSISSPNTGDECLDLKEMLDAWRRIESSSDN